MPAVALGAARGKSSRPRGRHRAGGPDYGEVPRRVFDPEQVNAAADLTRTQRGWLVMYGKHSRQFYGFPYVEGVEDPVVAATPEELVEAMRDAEDPLQAVVPQQRGARGW
ncbi:hypothetical protein DQ384_39520 [Sphaerisporangium album]|uniref:Uncharacterized protein n=1 Tax=Sphaerisporangium album TaxID=509200 RepID=A0A367EI73_9ACTN|nr:hypothetical protein [Sphaerisporangium album]RCG17788.1 hypothetical protein DQ384_39520 [Sphaerisporangium album]